MQTLTQSIGDTVTHKVALRWKNRPFEPGGAFPLVFSLKADKNDPDDDALFQKTYPSGGITLSGSTASIQILRLDTENLSEATFYWGIRATNDDGDSRTVADGTMVLDRAVTREVEAEMDVHTVAPPLLFFSYQSYLATNPDPELTEEQWVARLGSSNPQVVATVPPVPSNGYPLPYDGLEWFDPSDGSTSVWAWLVEGVEDSEDDGVFWSQFPTPATSGIPDLAYIDGAGAGYVDGEGAYYASA